MKVSASVRSARPEYALAAVWLAAHLPSLAPALEDIDSINFALGLHEFDLARHQPHPPGYPVYIALGRLSLAAVSRVHPSWDQVATDALSLALWSAIGGVVAIIAAAAFFREVAKADPPAAVDSSFWAVAIMSAAPLFWLTGLRPMSDMPGLGATLVALALTAKGMRERRWLPWGALVAGLAVGIRSQTMWLTIPVVVLAMVWQRRAGIAWLLTRPVAALAAGGIAWAVPLLASGGIDGYMRVLGTQAELDFAGVDMLWLNPTPRRLAFGLYETFVLPWATVPLATAVACAATVGALAMLLRARRGLLLLLTAFVPYFVFHLVLQETFTVRYALPLVPLVAWLAARGMATAGRRALPILATLLAGIALWSVVPAGIAFGREPHPAFRAIADASRRAAADQPAAMHTHYSLWRPLQATPSAPFRVVPPRNHFEWLGLVDYWRGGGTAPVWFLADPRRTDLALIDPGARKDVTRYGWSVADRPELTGTRPMGVDWYRLSPPGWFAGQGWSLTPETGGEARANAQGPDQRPIEAWVRRRSEPMHLLIGTRHLGDPGDPAAEFELAIDGRVRDSWTVTVEQRNVLRFLDVPEGLPGEGAYATLSVSSRSAGGDRRRAAAAVRQFDIQPASQILAGFGDGWHELEYEPSTGRMWRWSSDRSTLRIEGAPRALRLTLAGESPLRYFSAPPLVRILAGEQVIDEFRPDDDFVRSITIPEEAMAKAAGAISIAQDDVYLPGAAEGTADVRRLGLRLFDVRVDNLSDMPVDTASR